MTGSTSHAPSGPASPACSAPSARASRRPQPAAPPGHGTDRVSTASLSATRGKRLVSTDCVPSSAAATRGGAGLPPALQAHGHRDGPAGSQAQALAATRPEPALFLPPAAGKRSHGEWRDRPRGSGALGSRLARTRGPGKVRVAADSGSAQPLPSGHTDIEGREPGQRPWAYLTPVSPPRATLSLVVPSSTMGLCWHQGR